MSGIAFGWALQRAPMLLTEKSGKPDSTNRFVLVALANHADETGAGSRPSVEMLSAYTGLNIRTVQRHLDRLEAAGLITRTGTTARGVVIWQLSLHLDASEENERRAAAANEERKSRDSEYRRGVRSEGRKPSAGNPVSGPRIPTSGFEVPTSGSCVPMSVLRTTGALSNPHGTPTESSSGGSPAPRPPRPPSPSAPSNESGKVTQPDPTPSPRPSAQPPTARETALAAIRAAIARRPRTA